MSSILFISSLNLDLTVAAHVYADAAAGIVDPLARAGLETALSDGAMDQVLRRLGEIPKEVTLGGAGFNALVEATRRPGVELGLAGVEGCASRAAISDMVDRPFSDWCATHSVGAKALQASQNAPGICLVAETRPSRSLLTSIGANQELAMHPDDAARLHAAIEEADWLYVTSFFAPEAIRALAGLLTADRALWWPRIVLDPGIVWAEAAAAGEGSIREILRGADILLLNPREAEVLRPVPEAWSATTIIKKPSKTMLVAQRRETSFPHATLSTSEIRRDTGAGDAFGGGFVAAMADGNDYAEAIEQGAKAARRHLLAAPIKATAV